MIDEVRIDNIRVNKRGVCHGTRMLAIYDELDVQRCIVVAVGRENGQV